LKVALVYEIVDLSFTEDKSMMKEQPSSTNKTFNFPKDILNEIESMKAQLREEDSVKHQKESNYLDEELDFRFTALTQGLGFHQDEKNNVINVDATKISKPAPKNNTLYNQNVSLKKELDQFNRGDLSPLYNSKGTNSLETHPLFSHTKFETLKTTLPETIIENNFHNQVEPKVLAKPKDQILAWFIDLFVITSMLLVAICITFITLGIYDFETVSKLFTLSEAATYIAPFFVFFYLFYFTILDREGNSTLGKKILRIRIVSKFDEHLGLTQSFLRAAITLLSSLALGLPLVMDFQGKLTDSMVIKEEF
jgi:uncharacterized RDD family membrane protein YckC